MDFETDSKTQEVMRNAFDGCIFRLMAHRAGFLRDVDV